ncbi:peptidylprolyl isomerase [Glaciimonas sp. CA11.2]|uniref:peptidylprolyl isomerase n=2 Tax=Glaciimonas sp. CA11.2 TaxID=3048601 RepID=UPI002AB3C911|nr:peptidylprolyl isomerase [Glaciimonas sp. CA11.2]MDY7545148.1 peptidylprolyl isomerase [Glaciimonas sp. CA11.2]
MNALITMRKTNQSNHSNKLQLASIIVAMLFSVTSSAWAQKPAASPSSPPVMASPTTSDTAPAPSTAPASRATTANTPQTIDVIVAVVNNEVITRQELALRLKDVIQRMKSQGIEAPPPAELQKQLLERLILERAQVQAAKELGLSVDDKMLDAAIGRIAEQNKLSMSDFRKQLVHDNIPYPAFRDDIRREILLQRLREREVDNKIQITESEVDNYMIAEASNKQSQQAQQELNLAQILVRVPENASPAQVSARRKRAEEVLQQLKSGGNFGKIAATYSDAPDALTGGELGWRSQDRLPKMFLDAAATLTPGQVSPILQSANGFYVIRLNDKRAATNVEKPAAAPVEQTHARHILIKVTPTVSAAEAKKRLLELKDRLDNHAAKFEDLAKLYSNDLSASKGGDLGWIYPGDTVPEFQRAMDALKPGQISDPIETPFGYHLIQVLERKTDTVSADRKRLAARAAIRDRKTEEATNDWLRELRDRAYVEYRTEDNN